MGRTKEAAAAVAATGALSSRDPRNLGAIPPDVAVKIVTGDDGTVTIVRDLDGATWDGEQFVVPEPPPVPYAVIVYVHTIDDPSARAIVQAAIQQAKIDGATVASLAETVEGFRAECDRSLRQELEPRIRAELTPGIRPEVVAALRDELTPPVQEALVAHYTPGAKSVAVRGAIEAIQQQLAPLAIEGAVNALREAAAADGGGS